MNYWQGKNITLRAMEPDDYNLFFEALQDESIQKNESDIRIPMSLNACKDFALNQSLKGNDNESPFLIMVDNDNNKVGMATPSIVDKRIGIFTCGMFIKPEYQRKGFAHEALSLILKFYFGQMRCCKFEANVYEYNISSNKLCEKLGLVVEGRRRKSVYTDGRHFDEIMYGLTDDEYWTRHRTNML